MSTETHDPLSAVVPLPGVPATVPVPISDQQNFGEPEDITVIARSYQQMGKAKKALTAWIEKKILATQLEAADLAENIEIAKRQHWGTGALIRTHNRTVKLVSYYQKIKAALEAGYCIIPNFPVDIFAIRTNKRKPQRISNEPAEGIPAGEGRWVSNDPLGHYETSSKVDALGKLYTKEVFISTTLSETIGFPFVLAKPEILRANETAMVEKVFDELGVLPAKAKSDPMIVGRIIDPRGKSFDHRFLSFLVAWFIDTKDL